MKIIFGSLSIFLGLIPLSSQIQSEHALVEILSNCEKSSSIYQLNFPNSEVSISPTANIFNNKNKNAFVFPLRGDDKVSSLIKSSEIWLAGTDKDGNYKVAVAGRKNQFSDFYAGPLDINGQISPEICENWDKIFSVNKENILTHIHNFQAGVYEDTTNYKFIPEDVRYWPAYGNPFWKEKYKFGIGNSSLYRRYDFASFYDNDNDKIYNPAKGDFPTIDPCKKTEAIPDNLHFWILNDNGGPHRISGGDKIQIQINCYLYHYKSHDALNDVVNMRFHFINKADADIIDFYFGYNIDFDFLCPYDDKVGIDTSNNQIYIYNEELTDGINQENCDAKVQYAPYMLGIKYSGRTRAPMVFTYDQNGNKLFDELGRAILSDPPIGSGEMDTIIEKNLTNFIVNESCGDIAENNCFSYNDKYYYNIIRGKTREGNDLNYNGNKINFMYPSNPNDINGWSMCTDDAFQGKDIEALMSIGPLLLQPGASNTFDLFFSLQNIRTECADIITLIDESNSVLSSLDTKCYWVDHFGPYPPKVNINLEKDQQQIHIVIPQNEYNENIKDYAEPAESAPNGFQDSLSKIKFEGFLIFQLKDSSSYIDNPLKDTSRMRLIHQMDIKNTVSKVYKFQPKFVTKTYNKYNRHWESIEMVNGHNTGLTDTVFISKDLFTEDEKLQHNKNYWYAIYTYAFNNWKDLDTLTGHGQKNQFFKSAPTIHSVIYKDKFIEKLDSILHFPIHVYCKNEKVYFDKIHSNDEIRISEVNGRILYKGSSTSEAMTIYINDINNRILITEVVNILNHHRYINKVYCFD